MKNEKFHVLLVYPGYDKRDVSSQKHRKDKIIPKLLYGERKTRFGRFPAMQETWKNLEDSCIVSRNWEVTRPSVFTWLHPPHSSHVNSKSCRSTAEFHMWAVTECLKHARRYTPLSRMHVTHVLYAEKTKSCRVLICTNKTHC
jgi:hypothetical protein